MSDPHKSERERAELVSVLSSGVFDRAPSLSRFLSYICEKYFAGETDRIKEYNVAVEALGRTPDFDHARDSIVRVEAHRLRKRLRQYYAGDGADREFRIEIPSGGYVPEFVLQQTDAAKPKTIPAGKWRVLAAAAVGASLVVAATFALRMADTSGATPAPSMTAAGSIAPEPKPDSAIRISAGALRGQRVDSFGEVWSRDEYYIGGEALESKAPQQLQGLSDWPFQTYRRGQFGYDIPLDPGVYQLQLYFAAVDEAPAAEAGPGRIEQDFRVTANNREVLQTLDLHRDCGAGSVNVEVFTDIKPAEDGILHLRFNGQATLHGMEILPGIAGRLRPIRILAGRTTSHHDPRGRSWQGDRYVVGGLAVKRKQRVTGVSDPDLYSGERYGNFVYTLPVTPGSYTLNLMFAETWFGAANAGGGGAGSRIFDVTCNGSTLLRHFDIFKEAGGENRGLVKTFPGIRANPRNKIVLSFTSHKNLAAINAIELIPEE